MDSDEERHPDPHWVPPGHSGVSWNENADTSTESAKMRIAKAALSVKNDKNIGYPANIR